MRYVKDYKVFEMLAKELPEDDFNKWAIEVDNIIDVFQDIADSYNLILRTAYGTQVVMKYQDYIDRNGTYRNFVNGLPAMGAFFDTCISIIDNSSYDKNLELMGELESKFIRLLERGWILDSVESYYNTKNFNKYANSIGITCKFKYEDYKGDLSTSIIKPKPPKNRITNI